MGRIILAVIASFLITVIAMPIAIPILRRLKFGQSIRDEGPSWHKKKSGTPTMGGIVFIFAILITALLFSKYDGDIWLLVLATLLFGVIGFIDDYIKVILKRNLGLAAWQKFAMQLLVALGVVIGGIFFGNLDTKIIVPFIGTSVNIGSFYIPFAIFIVLATVNGVNLTDGIDGLAGSVTLIIMVFWAIWTYNFGNSSATVFAAACAGGLMGFLVFNSYPAKVFMGDTGSLFLGSAVACLSLITKNPLVLAIIGIVYIAETLSVIIQVTSFKLTGKRVFKMSPIHHHFEMCGWKEVKIVAVFSFITAVASLLAFFIFA